MTPEQQRIAIAEACGWVKSQYGKWSNNGLILPDPLNPPDYLKDLNAMHQAEMALKQDDPHAYGCYCSNLYEEHLSIVSLTASVRAEMFLKTVGKWKEARK